jgi:hypothetical protein
MILLHQAADIVVGGVYNQSNSKYGIQYDSLDIEKS